MTSSGGVPPHLALKRVAFLSAGSLLATLSVALLGAPGARADADPASDVLLMQRVFFPYAPTVPEGAEVSLEAAVEQAAEEGLPLRIAIIDSPEDLGAVPKFFGHPQAYAEFLDREISFPPPAPPVPLVVIMPAGLAVAGVSPPNSLARVPVHRSDSAYGLVNTAMAAVHELLRERGHDITTPAARARRQAVSTHDRFERPKGPKTLLFALPVALVGLAGIVAYVRRRTARGR